MPDIDTDGAVTIAETIRTGILDLGIRHDAGTSGRLTVSIGVTTSYPEHDDDMQGALKLADDALARRKAGATASSRTRPLPASRRAGLSGRTRHAAERWPSKGRTAAVAAVRKIADNVASTCRRCGAPARPRGRACAP